ncbi:hypothetical protein ACRWQM_03870 [Shewanella sp. HL-SH5]|uniref:hypothetical protein n=1 Tax=Shewanella sp. HL-SH5 TaxID=3436241 RepID=UPI003EC06D97
MSNELSPLYFETGENSDELGEFLINLNKSKVDIDIDADDALKITKLMGMLDQVLGEEELVLNKNYIINVSVSKLFNCVPCTEQLNYLSTLELDKFNRINIFLIE